MFVRVGIGTQIVNFAVFIGVKVGVHNLDKRFVACVHCRLEFLLHGLRCVCNPLHSVGVHLLKVAVGLLDFGKLPCVLVDLWLDGVGVVCVEFCNVVVVRTGRCVSRISSCLIWVRFLCCYRVVVHRFETVLLSNSVVEVGDNSVVISRNFFLLRDVGIYCLRSFVGGSKLCGHAVHRSFEPGRNHIPKRLYPVLHDGVLHRLWDTLPG